MKIISRLTLLLILFSPCIKAQQLGKNANRNNFTPNAPLREQPTVKWQFKTKQPVVGSPVVKDQTLFIGSADSCLYALDKRTGKQLWKFATQGAITSSVACDSNTVYFLSGDANIYALNVKTGQLKWRFQTGGEKATDPWDYFLSSPALDNGTLYIGSTDGNIYALDKNSGTQKWKFATGGAVHAAPTVADNTVLVGSFDGWFYALHTDGTLKWKFDTMGERNFPIGEVQFPAVVTDTCVYFCARDYNVYALHLHTGKGLWVYHEDGSWSCVPSLAENTLLVTTSDTHRALGFDAMYGGLQWNTPVNLNVFSAIAATNGHGYMGTLDGEIYTIDLKTGKGKVIFQHPAREKHINRFIDKASGKLYPDLIDRYKGDIAKIYADFLDMGSILSTPWLEEGTLYFGSTDGQVYALQ